LLLITDTSFVDIVAYTKHTCHERSEAQLQDTASYEQYFEEKKFPAAKSNQQILSREMVKRP